MKNETSVIEVIKKRRSNRTFINKDLSKEQIDNINSILQQHTEGPFGNKVSFKLITKKIAKENHKVKLGTYGFISGAAYFIAGQVTEGEFANMDYGYLMEKIILEMTGLGYGTCWLGGTFSRSEFGDIIEMKDDTIIPAITPLGFAAETKTIKESLIRWGAKADSRKAWKELFFDGSFKDSLSKEKAGDYAVALEMVRIGPSASNKQPWRVCKTEAGFHFYLKRNPGYGMISKGVDLQMVDMGISMAHFELTCKEMNLKGNWENNNPVISSAHFDQYCISWEI